MKTFEECLSCLENGEDLYFSAGNSLRSGRVFFMLVSSNNETTLVRHITKSSLSIVGVDCWLEFPKGSKGEKALEEIYALNKKYGYPKKRPPMEEALKIMLENNFKVSFEYPFKN